VRRTLRWAVPAVGVLLAGAAVAGLAVGGGAVTRPTALAWLVFGAGSLACGELLRAPRPVAARPVQPVGAPGPAQPASGLVSAPRPGQPVGVLLSAAGLLLLAAAAAAEPLSLGVSGRLAVAAGLALFPLAALVYPDRPLPAVAGPVVVGAVLLATAVAAVRPERTDIVASMALVVAVAVIAGVWWRYETAGPDERRPLQWVVLAGGIGLVAGVLVFVLELPQPALAVALLVPVSFVIGLRWPELADARQHTVQIVVIGVTVLLYIAVFTGTAGLVRAAGGEPGDGLLALFGAVLAMAFRPTRLLLQGAVEELLFGDRADPGRAMAGVGERLSDDPVLALRALRQSLVLPYAALLADGAVVACSGTATTPTRSYPLQAGAVGAELVVGLRPGELRLRSADETALAVVAPALGQALHARLLATELRRSRGEVISVIEEERRRLRRDLHDGLGPTLTGVAYAADAARNLLAADPAAADALLADLRTDTAHAIGEIRRLVEGLRPPMLDELGLTQAIRQRARQLRTADGRALVVAVDAPEQLPDVPAAVEVVAFRIVVEALTNVCRHAGSDRAAVAIAVAGDALELEIRDGGRAGGPWTPGVGLASMRERAESVGGSCTAAATPDGGLVSACLPLVR
jgi:two-component system, NarL family, sensor kinase